MKQIISTDNRLDFMGKRKLAMIFSGALILISIVSFFGRGFDFGIDFTGGTLIEVGYPQAVDLNAARDVLDQGGFGDATVQLFGTDSDILIQLPPSEETEAGSATDKAEISNRAFALLNAAGGGDLDLRRVEFVGSKVGDELTEQGGLAMLYALIGILIYVGLRFEYRFALGSIIALVHDVVLVLGVFSLFQIEFDLPVLAAVLAVIGYSLNDTIVVYDRIRENFRKMRKGSPEEIINRSLNQTLARTLVTSLTTLLVLFALFILGGEIIHGFALALIVGVVVGTYSSIYVASAAVLALGISKEDLMPPEKEGAELDDTP